MKCEKDLLHEGNRILQGNIEITALTYVEQGKRIIQLKFHINNTFDRILLSQIKPLIHTRAF